LHKYNNRALLLVKGGCAVNCRYCFRRHFPYQDNQGNKANWVQALDYIRTRPELDEIIFSGGDPLMAKDHELDWLIGELEGIAHIKRLRIHTRLPVVIPARITDALCQRLEQSRLQVLMVTHINHANEIDDALRDSMAKLKKHGVTLLNQSVLLRDVNDSADVLAALSNALFDAGILPYYIHVLDKVQGAAHFMVSDDEARVIMKALMSKVSGYMVPKLTREIGGEPSKTILDLRLKQDCTGDGLTDAKRHAIGMPFFMLYVRIKPRVMGTYKPGRPFCCQPVQSLTGSSETWAVSTINHVAAHCCRFVTQIVGRTTHGAAVAAGTGEPVALGTSDLAEQLTFSRWLVSVNFTC
jgi:L-lysine 2,3-aminomutase